MGTFRWWWWCNRGTPKPSLESPESPPVSEWQTGSHAFSTPIPIILPGIHIVSLSSKVPSCVLRTVRYPLPLCRGPPPSHGVAFFRSAPKASALLQTGADGCRTCRPHALSLERFPAAGCCSLLLAAATATSVTAGRPAARLRKVQTPSSVDLLRPIFSLWPADRRPQRRGEERRGD